jgi:hydroxyacylglutathione hydrolase
MGARPERVADDVWIVRGGFRGNMSVYLIKAPDGVTVFDAGIRAMAGAIREAAAGLGQIKRVVLGHAHPDHRGAANNLAAPVFCHPAERRDAESERGEHYFDLSKLDIPARFVFPGLLSRWDGGPVSIAGTVEEGDEVAGFEVLHLPGHAPGLIALWRASDRLILTSDAFYRLDPQTGRRTSPSPPHAAFNLDEEGVRASLVRIAELDPHSAWPGHADPVVSNVKDALRRAADEPRPRSHPRGA